MGIRLIAKYDYLIELFMERAHDDYIEEFLCNTKTCFRKNISLRILHQSLLRVTKDFTREDTRINCTKVENLWPYGKWRSTKSFQEYFPLIKESDYIYSFYVK